MKTLSELRAGYSMTQEELADAFGVTSRTIHNLEKDSSNIRDSILKKYMIFFNVDYDDIFLGNEYEKNVFLDDRYQEALSRID